MPPLVHDHRTVNHGAGEYARRDPDGTCMHCNTMEGLWSGLRNFLDRFKGISQRFLSLASCALRVPAQPYALALGSDLRNSLRYIFSTTGDYLRQMTHQHRRMPLTLCYR
jgi:hypothetical protein